jgi:hypothetical protein
LIPPEADPLAPLVRRLFTDLQHAGPPASSVSSELPPPSRTARGRAGQDRLGTRVQFELSSHASDGIDHARFSAYGCPHTLAVCEWLCRELEAGRLDHIGTPADWCRVLDIPIVKLGRLLVVEDALRASLSVGAAAGFDWTPK